ncbi:zinc-binding dehydrogenase [Luteimonas viscosa]|uniref:enoyl-[acyl-carrier-protein] reductase n=1 Tax=Luteimonas viscosa TaxID=1132694 RepID=A0A5D4XUG3_9GAMM|nr:zinc-binding dehydrogenase [Luteimonas viscosa]TYT26632.1 zinc-binding dehydrogenase [Luteimonas viscosa]
MRSAVHASFGEPADVIGPADSPMPQPGPGEVRVRMTLAPIHNHDLWTIRGQYGWKPSLPAIGGSEACGVVDALGEGVEGLRVGQRVNTAAGRGTWAEYFVTPAGMAIPLPDAIPDEVAAQLVAMPLSALMLLEFLDVQPGQWIVQNAANGAVGKTLAMLAAARGVNVLSLVRRDAGVDELAAVGVDNAVSCASPDWRDRAKAMLGKGRARAAVDSVGGQASADLASLLGEEGVLVSFGSMSGEPMQIPSGDMIFRHLVVKGFWGSKVGREMGADDRRRLVGELLQRAAQGELRLPVDAIHPLGEAAQAMAASLRKGRAGKVLLRP